jgi:hypothetical protein
MLEEKEESERFDKFVMYLHANPMTDSKARNQYMKAIEPRISVKERVGSMKTNLDQLKRLQSELKAEMEA